MKRQPTEWGKEINFQNIQTAYIASSILARKKKSNKKNGQKTQINISPKKTNRWPKGT